MNSIFRKRSSESNDGKFLWAQELVLKNLKHKSKFVLCPNERISYQGRGALFYEELTHGSRVNINECLYKLWDTFQPSAIDTNCGYRSKCTGFHWKMVFNTKDFMAILKETFWNSEKESSTEELKELTEFIEHFEKLSTDYLTIDQQKLLKHHVSDLMFYNHHYIPLQSKSKAKWAFSDKFQKNVIENELLYNLNEFSDATSIYLEFKTNDTRNDFKMVKYAKNVNEMIDKILSSMPVISRRCSEYMKGMKHKINSEDIDEVSGWFKLNILTKEEKAMSVALNDECIIEKQGMITIVVEAQMALFTFVFFIWYFHNNEKKMKELKHWLKSYKKRLNQRKRRKSWIVKRCKVWEDLTHEFHFMKEERKLYPLSMMLEDGLLIDKEKEQNAKIEEKEEEDVMPILHRRKSQDVRNSIDEFFERRMSGTWSHEHDATQRRGSQDVRAQ